MKFELLEPYIPMFMSGLVVTCQVTAAALAIALVLGFLIAVLKVLLTRLLFEPLFDFCARTAGLHHPQTGVQPITAWSTAVDRQDFNLVAGM